MPSAVMTTRRSSACPSNGKTLIPYVAGSMPLDLSTAAVPPGTGGAIYTITINDKALKLTKDFFGRRPPAKRSKPT